MSKNSESSGKGNASKSTDSDTFPIPELYFGVVRAIGTPLKPIVDALEKNLKEARFTFHPIKVSECLEKLPKVMDTLSKRTDESPYNRYQRLRASGFWLRSETKRRDAVVVAAVAALNSGERAKARQAARKKRGIAYLFRSIHHPKEVERLRKLYDRQLFVISVYSSNEDREQNLNHQLGEGYRQGARDPGNLVTELMRDEDQLLPENQRYDKKLSGLSQYSTDITQSFQQGDLFLDVNDPENPRHIERFVDLIFGEPFHTPTQDEIGMADAFGAQLESGNLARQVGASIVSSDGDLLAAGTNDVPRPGGGVYRSDDHWDFRDFNGRDDLKGFRRGWDVSDTTRRHILTDLLRRMLADTEWLIDLDAAMKSGFSLDSASDGPASELANLLGTSVNSEGDLLHNTQIVDALARRLIQSDFIWGAQFFDVLEYGRTMHAEMDAITSAARKGVSIRNATLYCTTLPCHECARLIIGSGIQRVIFIEPYEKSRIESMYDSEINFTTLARSRNAERARRRQPPEYPPDLDQRVRVDFVPYVGVSPRRFHELFSFVSRKLEDQEGEPRVLSGRRAKWDKGMSEVRETIVSDSAIHSPARLQDLIAHEQELVREFEEAVAGIGV
jgi:cytidine deaminase